MNSKPSIDIAALRKAAHVALDRGWYVFPSPCKTKSAFRGTHGSLDAINADNTPLALKKWDEGVPANPCIRLDRSGLTVLDVDHGLHSFAEAEAWANRNGIPDTYIVSSGRGYHFYFIGVRALRDCVRNLKAGRVGFELDGISGDIKCHGHVVAEGGLHKSGSTYCGNGKPVAPLPQFLWDYEDPIVKKRREAFTVKASVRASVKASSKVSTAETTLIPVGERHDFLVREAGRLRQMGLESDAIYLGIQDVCKKFCADGEAYAASSDIKQLAEWTGAQLCTRRICKDPQSSRGLKLIMFPQQQDVLAESLKEFRGKPATFDFILKRIVNEYPATSRVTLWRAIKQAGFRAIGKDPADRRSSLWLLEGDSFHD